ncbi:glycosyltransferase family 4 protein [Hymenobacter coccineus]|uniref:glycosyltransferase family 4 protein n=1 Tax=Hymenobacter coccineus TaxID=1908235 RepID=UPI000F77DC44|nr:glycosyltransferase family 4 protein [Hymenobacter coccineus]
MKDKTILSIITNLTIYGGAEKVLVDVHNGLKEIFPAKITGFQNFADLHPKLGITANEYVKFTNPFLLRNKIIIVHARNIIPFIVLLKRFLFLNTTVIYISHNVYDSLRYFTFFPKTIISISNKVTQNMINYFRIDNKNIKLIYNGLEDTSCLPSKIVHQYTPAKIRILYSARVNKVKRQLHVVRALAGGLLPQIEIHFAGIGEEHDELVRACEKSQNFVALGFVEDMNSIIPNYDYLMLYSAQEGLPLSLIEGTMHSKPLLVNDVGGNLEIGIPGFNGFELSEIPDTLISQLNNLVNFSEEQYHLYACNSRQHYEARFTRRKMITKYVDLIHNLT